MSFQQRKEKQTLGSFYYSVPVRIENLSFVVSLTLLNSVVISDDSSSAELLYVTIRNLNASHVNSASENLLLLTVTQ